MADTPDVTLSWDVKNWVTVLLMVAIGFALISLVAQVVRNAPALMKGLNLNPAGTMNNAPPLAS